MRWTCACGTGRTGGAVGESGELRIDWCVSFEYRINRAALRHTSVHTRAPASLPGDRQIPRTTLVYNRVHRPPPKTKCAHGVQKHAAPPPSYYRPLLSHTLVAALLPGASLSPRCPHPAHMQRMSPEASTQHTKRTPYKKKALILSPPPPSAAALSCGASYACRPACRRHRAGRCRHSYARRSDSTSPSQCPPRRSTTRGRSPKGALNGRDTPS